MIPGQPVSLPEESDSEDPAEPAPPADIGREPIAPPPAVPLTENSPRQYVFEGMERLPGALTSFVERRLRSKFGSNWQARVDRQLHDKKKEFLSDWLRYWSERPSSWDQWVLLNVVDVFWSDTFSAVLGRRGIGDADIKELIEVRNKLAHNEPFGCNDAEDALDLMRRLTKAVHAAEATAKLDAMHKATPCIWGNNFKGFPFGDVHFDDSKGGNVLHFAMEALRERDDLRHEIRIDPNCQGRPDTRGDGGVVWDVLRFADANTGEFFENPHLTLGVGSEYVSAMTTLSNKAWKEYRSVLIGIGADEFRNMVRGVLKEMDTVLSDCCGMEPRLRVRQRRWPKPSARPLVDAYTDVDMRTLDGNGGGDSESDVKRQPERQPEWVGAVFSVLKDENSNLELQIGASFPYRTCPKIAGPNALDCVARTWIACKPYIKVLFGGKTATVFHRPLDRPKYPEEWLRR